MWLMGTGKPSCGSEGDPLRKSSLSASREAPGTCQEEVILGPWLLV